MVRGVNGNRYTDLLADFDALRREIDRVFEEAGFGRWGLPYMRTSFLPGRQARAYPLINLSEDSDNIYAEALAPGIDPESLNITVTRDQLTLSGEKAPISDDIKPEEFHRSERAAGKFVRTIRLNSEVDPDRVKADYKNGLLLITMPKAEEYKPKRITVTTS